MKDVETREQFITLRAEGKTFDAIAEQIGVNRRTLITWSQDHRLEIANLRSARMEALREEYCLSVEARTAMFGELVDRIRDELADRDLSDVPTHKLTDMLLKVETRLQEAYIQPEYHGDTEIQTHQQLTKLIQDIQHPEQ